MPFRSKAQQGFLFAKKPNVAREFAKKTSKRQFKRLPARVKGSELEMWYSQRQREPSRPILDP